MLKLRRMWLVFAVAAIAVGLAQSPAEACGQCDAGEHKKVCAVSGEKECALGEKMGTDACKAAHKAAADLKEAGIDFVTADALHGRIKAGDAPIIVDVLPQSSYLKRRVQGAINIPVTEIEELAPKVLPDKQAEIVVYCGGYKCYASVKAAKALKELGYENVGDFKAGIQKWAEKDYPMQGSDVN